MPQQIPRLARDLRNAIVANDRGSGKSVAGLPPIEALPADPVLRRAFLTGFAAGLRTLKGRPVGRPAG